MADQAPTGVWRSGRGPHRGSGFTMLYQLTAYEVFDRLVLSLVAMEATEDGKAWTKLLLENEEVPPWVQDPWDMVWLIGQRLSEAALEHGSGSAPAAARSRSQQSK